MHEMSLALSIRRIVEDKAREQGFARVTRLRLEIGAFASIDPHALRFAFGPAMAGSPAEGATLDIIDVPGQAVCYGCGARVETSDRLMPCPECGGGLLATGGDDMRIRDMEVQ